MTVTSSTAAAMTTTDTTTTTEEVMILRQLENQMEFYFSPRNLNRDLFLKNLLQSHAGAVPLERICNFPKIRELYAMYMAAIPQQQQPHLHTTPLSPMALVQRALEHSTVIQVSDDGNFVVPRLAPDDARMMMATTQSRSELPPAVVGDADHNDTDIRLQEPSLSTTTKTGPTTPTSPVSSPCSTSSLTTASSVGVPTHPLSSEQGDKSEPNPSGTKAVTTIIATKERTTLIVRDIPDSSTADEVLEAFTSEAIAPTSVRPEIGNTWYVTFETEAQAMAALTTSFDKTIQGQPIRAHLKTELTNAQQNGHSSSPAHLSREMTGGHNPSSPTTMTTTTQPTLSTNDKSMVVILSPQEQVEGYMRQQQEYQQQQLLAHSPRPPPMMPYAYPADWQQVPPELYPYYYQPVLVAAPAGYNVPPPQVGIQYHMMPQSAFGGYQQPPVFPFEYHPQLMYHLQPQYHPQQPLQYYPESPRFHHHPHQHAVPPPNVFVHNYSSGQYPSKSDGSEAARSAGGKRKKKKSKKTKSSTVPREPSSPPPPPLPYHAISCPSPSSTITHDPAPTTNTATTDTDTPTTTTTATAETLTEIDDMKPQPMPRRHSNPHESTREYSETTSASITSTASTAASTVTATTTATFVTARAEEEEPVTTAPPQVPVALFTEDAFPALGGDHSRSKSSAALTVPPRPAYAEALKKRPQKKTQVAPAAPETESKWTTVEAAPWGALLTVEEILRQLGCTRLEPNEEEPEVEQQPARLIPTPQDVGNDLVA